MHDRSLKRLRKKAKKRLRGWPAATIAFYGPDLSRASKVAVGITPSEAADALEVRDWQFVSGDVRSDPQIALEILEFVERHGVLSVIMTDTIIGCPHQHGIDYEGEWCPICEFWNGRDRWTGQPTHEGCTLPADLHMVSRRYFTKLAPQYSTSAKNTAPMRVRAPSFLRDGGSKNVTNGMRSSAMANASACFTTRGPRPKREGLSTNPKSHSLSSF